MSALNSITFEQQDKDQSYLGKLIHSILKFNPCLRPQSQAPELTQYLKKFQQVSLYLDPYYGQCYLLQAYKADLLQIIRKEKHSQNQINQRLQQISEVGNFSMNPNVIKQDIVAKVTKKGFLWTNVQLYLAYDYILIDLEKQFQHRITTGQKFSESQIITIVKETLRALIHLETTNYNSVRLRNIYFTPKSPKLIKLAHPKLFNYETNLALLCQSDKYIGIYLAPEELISLHRGQKDANYGSKANAFVFGMVILSLMNMQHLNQVYNFSSCQIYDYKIEDFLNSARAVYSQRLVSIVEGLLQQSPQRRFTLKSALSKFSQRYEPDQNIQVTLLQQKTIFVNQNRLSMNQMQYQPLPIQQEKTYPNHLRGFVFPKVGFVGEYVNQAKNQNRKSSNIEESVTANKRYYYQNRNSSYVGDGTEQNANKLLEEKPTREGHGIYRNEDGQLYIGEWSKGQMNGFGKLYWNENKIRYEGDFVNGKFHGKGIQYPQQYKEDPDTDQKFIRMQRGNWLKYDGNYKNDKRQGQGIVYFSKGKWTGNFKNNQPNGQGIFFHSNGNKYKGYYQDGVMKKTYCDFSN